jgi:pimeloyl-ACP methyl ester carboxylesterase
MLFPGYSAAKDTLLPEAVALQSIGFDVLLVDFRGAGGSSGRDNTLGIREAEDVAAVVTFARDRWAGRRTVLFGRSMGAAAILRAVAHLEVKADALILESPFDRMLNTVRNRFRSMGLPTFPGSEMLVFWGGWRLGFDGFSHNPEEYAERVTFPTLVMSGAEDARATPEQVRAIFDRLRGAKRLAMFDGVGHEPLKERQSEVWGREVNAFLQSINP